MLKTAWNGLKNTNGLINKQIKAIKMIRKEGDVKSEFLYYIGETPVIHSNEIHHLHLSTIGLATKNLFGIGQIIVDDKFLEMSEWAQMFVLAHELGHIHNGHLDEEKNFFKAQFLRGVRTMQNKVDINELQADTFAALIVGPEKAIAALTELNKIAGEYSLSGSNKEAKLRIQEIKRLVEIGFFEGTDAKINSLEDLKGWF